MESFTDLDAWKKGIELVKEVYQLSKRFPKEEQFGLTSQIRRAATSILINLAEGFSRSTPGDKAYKYTISRGECSEIKAILLICSELEIVSEQESQPLIELSETTGKLLSGLINKYSPNPNPNPITIA